MGRPLFPEPPMLWSKLADLLLTLGYIEEAFYVQRQWACRLLRQPSVQSQRVPRTWPPPDLRRQETRVKRPS
jgi:hypothetical protein